MACLLGGEYLFKYGTLCERHDISSPVKYTSNVSRSLGIKESRFSRPIKISAFGKIKHPSKANKRIDRVFLWTE